MQSMLALWKRDKAAKIPLEMARYEDVVCDTCNEPLNLMTMTEDETKVWMIPLEFQFGIICD